MKFRSFLISVVVAIGCGGESTAPTAPTVPSQTITTTFRDANTIVAQCPTPTEVSESDLDLTITFESDPTANQIVCNASQSSRDLTLLQAQVYRVLSLIRFGGRFSYAA